jgi:PadR family transcriptional regulator PadR
LVLQKSCGKALHSKIQQHFCLAIHNTSMYHRRMKITKDLVAASAVPLILSLLEEGESYGYAIIQRVRALSGGAIEWTDGMLYPVLHRLEAQGYIASSWRNAETGRKRKYYALRGQGRTALEDQKEQWLIVHGTLAKLWGV